MSRSLLVAHHVGVIAKEVAAGKRTLRDTVALPDTELTERPRAQAEPISVFPPRCRRARLAARRARSRAGRLRAALRTDRTGERLSAPLAR